MARWRNAMRCFWTAICRITRICLLRFSAHRSARLLWISQSFLRPARVRARDQSGNRSAPARHYDSATFGGRPIYRLATAELVRYAEFVLAHTSTAISYAVLYSKPLVFIYTAGMAAAYEHWFIREMRCFADYLGRHLLQRRWCCRGATSCRATGQSGQLRALQVQLPDITPSKTTPTQEIVWQEIHAQ